MKLQTTKPVTLRLPPFKRVYITLVGCGGTGSHLASGLCTLILALKERDITTRLQLIDPDRVEEKNVGRQLFGRAEIGLPKSGTLALRLGQVYTLPIDASIRAIGAGDTFVERDALSIVIGAVDNVPARKTISRAVATAAGTLWAIDAGNENHSGQVLIGNCSTSAAMKGSVALGMTDRLPSPYLVYPDLIKTPKKVKPASCADAVATGEQGLMVNRMMAAWTLTLLHDFLFGQLNYFGVSVDLKFAGVKPYLLDMPTLSEVTGLTPDELKAGAKHAKGN